MRETTKYNSIDILKYYFHIKSNSFSLLLFMCSVCLEAKKFKNMLRSILYLEGFHFKLEIHFFKNLMTMSWIKSFWESVKDEFFKMAYRFPNIAPVTLPNLSQQRPIKLGHKLITSSPWFLKCILGLFNSTSFNFLLFISLKQHQNTENKRQYLFTGYSYFPEFKFFFNVKFYGWNLHIKKKPKIFSNPW